MNLLLYVSELTRKHDLEYTKCYKLCFINPSFQLPESNLLKKCKGRFTCHIAQLGKIKKYLC